MNGNPARSGCNANVLLQPKTKSLLLSGMKAAKERLSWRGRCPGTSVTYQQRLEQSSCLADAS